MNVVSPNDAAAHVSFEKLELEILDLDGVIDIPLVNGKLTPLTHASRAVENQLLRDRPRDGTLPQYSAVSIEYGSRHVPPNATDAVLLIAGYGIQDYFTASSC